MEDVLAVYTRPRDPDYLLVCLDESSRRFLAETRVPIPMKPGRPARFDYEYERNGTANLFMNGLFVMCHSLTPGGDLTRPFMEIGRARPPHRTQIVVSLISQLRTYYRSRSIWPRCARGGWMLIDMIMWGPGG
jgi:hypothetical protein